MPYSTSKLLERNANFAGYWKHFAIYQARICC